MSAKLKNKPEFCLLPIEKLVRGRYQPRANFDQQALRELAKSISMTGLIQPIVVRPLRKDFYEIVAGERRWRAAQLAELQYVNCLVNRYSDEQTAAITAIENVNRQDLNPIEEAKAYQQLIEEFDYSHDEVAAAIGKSRTKVTNILRLLKLDPSVQTLLINHSISEGHGKILVSLPSTVQRQLAIKSAARGWTIRRLEKELKTLECTPKQFFNKDPNLNKLEQAISEHLGCKVEIEFSSNKLKGCLKVDFYSLDILEGILEKMGLEP